MELLNNNKNKFGFLLGDNIYEHGVASSLNPQFKTKFEKPYRNINKIILFMFEIMTMVIHFLKNNAGFQVSYSDIF